MKFRNIADSLVSFPTLKSWRLVSNNCNFFPLGIFLSGFKLSTKEIDEKLSVFREEDGALPMDQVIALKR